jgi:hypothetical protein
MRLQKAMLVIRHEEKSPKNSKSQVDGFKPELEIKRSIGIIPSKIRTEEMLPSGNLTVNGHRNN